MTGRAGPGPNERSATPGWFASVAPSVALELLRQVLPREHGRRLVGIELAARVGADRHHLAVVQLGVDGDVER